MIAIHRSSVSRLIGMGLFLGASGVACGARTALRSDLSADNGNGGATSSASNGQSTSGNRGSGGGGGQAPLICAALAWAGPPVFVSTTAFGPAVRSPHIIDVGSGDYGVAFQATDGTVPGAYDLASFKVVAPFDAWPPTVALINQNNSLQLEAASSEGEPGQIAFASSDGNGTFTLLESPPGANGGNGIEFGGASEAVDVLDRNDNGAYLLIHGPSAQHTASYVASFGSGAPLTTLGLTGCATQVATAVAGIGNGQWIIASAQDSAADSCFTSPPSAPTFLQTQLASAAGLVHVSNQQFDVPVDEVRLARRGQGAWMAARSANDTRIYQVESDGTFSSAVFADWVSSQSNAAHDIASLGDTFGLAEIIAQETQPGGDLNVGAFVDFQFLTVDGFTYGIFPTDKPSLMTSSGHRSLLVAFVDEGGAGPRIGLLRADCQDTVGK